MAPHESSGPIGVAVVTVSYGSEDVLPAFLDSIVPASSTTPVVVVVDNQPEVGEVADIARRAGATYLPMASNAGYGAAINAAIRSLPASVSWVLVSNPDVTLGSGSVDILLRTADSDPAIAAVGPAIMSADGGLYPSARAIPSIRMGVGHAVFSTVWKTNPWSRAYHQNQADHPRDAGWLSGACFLVRRSTFDELRGFDAGYFMYFEDVDFGARLGRAGYRSVYQPEARVVHTGAHSTASRSVEMVDAHHRSAARFLGTRYPERWQAPIRWALLAGLRLRSRVVRRARSRSVDSTGPQAHGEDAAT